MSTTQAPAPVVPPGAEPPTRPSRSSRGPHRAGPRTPWWFVVPALVLYALIVLWPNLQGLFYSFTDWDGLGSAWSLAGVSNFSRVLQDPNTLRAIGNTFLITVIVTVGQNLIGLLLALGLNTQVRSRYVLRLVFFLPVVLTPIVAGFLWKYLLSPTGTVNAVLEAIGLGSWKQDWLGDPSIAIYSICAAIIWQGAGYSMVIFLAGLQGVPEETLEAAAIDGAGPLRRTVSIVLPLINGSIVVNVLLTLISTLKQFDTVFAMTKGGPAGATETMATIVYKTAFTYLQYPTALAQGVVLTVVVGVIAFAQFRLTQRKGDLS
ncbi:raffinose/stachyose/melibiose transport system permease protein [Rathayibacter sp. PhB127]|uniref:carbohydrate ABC transporter permease n=1 Tax=Rathayibacter sp. PhB127 TaxID=2485176 RepID=UPI000F4CD61B|nr:sugar ABC transporter permease [Rathayibacter sp. PhB127]ROS21576.1 raffinose/stachyose/melibiose transport system permease protein [Rathayibacter sp. PhB127]